MTRAEIERLNKRILAETLATIPDFVVAMHRAGCSPDDINRTLPKALVDWHERRLAELVMLTGEPAGRA